MDPAAYQRPGETVWVRLPAGGAEAYAEGRVVSADGPQKITVDVGGTSSVVGVEDMLHVNPDTVQPDLTNLMVLNEATMLDNLRQRFTRLDQFPVVRRDTPTHPPPTFLPQLHLHT